MQRNINWFCVFFCMRPGFLALMICFSFFFVASFAAISCSVKASCGVGETDMMHLSAASNAHAETRNGNDFSSHLCCSVSGGMIQANSGCNSQDDGLFLTLSDTKKAHAELPRQAYSHKLCFNIAGGGKVSCSSAVGAEGDCVISLSSATNAHVTACSNPGADPLKVICKLNSAPGSSLVLISIKTKNQAGEESSAFEKGSVVRVEYTIQNLSATVLDSTVEVSLKTKENLTLISNAPVVVSAFPYSSSSGSTLLNLGSTGGGVYVIEVSVPRPAGFEDVSEESNGAFFASSQTASLQSAAFSNRMFITIVEPQTMSVPELPLYYGVLVGLMVLGFLWASKK